MSLKVIDISSHNSVDTAGRADAEGVIVKTTEGTGYVNPRADAQYQLAKSKGKLLGIYHYASGGDPIAEANYFYANSKNYFHEAIPFLDWESGTNAAWGNSNWCRQFVDQIHKLSGVWCGIYVQASAINQVANLVNTCALWVAGYPDNRDSWTVPAFNYNIKPWSTYTIWQFTSSNGALDRNVAIVDKTGWGKIANPTGATVSKPVAPAKPAAYSTAGKTVDQLANDVIAGKVGSGQARINALGKFYTATQAVVNYKLKTGSLSLTNGILATEVKKGVFGVGNTRQQLLGGFYNGVQAVINSGAGATVAKSVNTIAREVIQGKWGNEPQRSQRLRAAGYNPSTVQAEVNRLL